MRHFNLFHQKAARKAVFFLINPIENEKSHGKSREQMSVGVTMDAIVILSSFISSEIKIDIIRNYTILSGAAQLYRRLTVVDICEI